MVNDDTGGLFQQCKLSLQFDNGDQLSLELLLRGLSSTLYNLRWE